jgi:carotenoid cleavage dioxygenase-like enzyme
MDGSQAQQNPFLTGNFGPVRSEDDFALKVTGRIPEGLNGSLYRNGPNPQFEPVGRYHWFGGDGMIHAFVLEDGKARYRNRWVKTPRWQAEHEAGHALFASMGGPPNPAIAHIEPGVGNTNIVHHAGKLMALVEVSEPFELDPVTLDPRGYGKTGGKFTAHPKMDAETGEMVWFAYSAGPQPLNNQIDYGVTDASGKVVRRDRFEAPYTSMIHDFIVTQNHVLFPVLPLTGSIERAMKGGPAFAWEPEKGAFVGVMGRNASVDSIRWFQLPPAYVFHPMNAWEDGSLIHAEVMEYPIAPLFPNADGSPGERTGAVLVRWTFDLAAPTNDAKRTVLDDMSGEFPRFDERRMGRSYRHGWFASNTQRGDVQTGFDSLSHIDLTTGRRTTVDIGGGDMPGEPIFVPRSADAPEGEGWLLSVVYRKATDTSDLLIFDAEDMAAGPVATVHVPRRVPFGFHGNWVSA